MRGGRTVPWVADIRIPVRGLLPMGRLLCFTTSTKDRSSRGLGNPWPEEEGLTICCSASSADRLNLARLVQSGLHKNCPLKGLEVVKGTEQGGFFSSEQIIHGWGSGELNMTPENFARGTRGRGMLQSWDRGLGRVGLVGGGRFNPRDAGSCHSSEMTVESSSII
jgi:hypothetical protein